MADFTIQSAPWPAGTAVDVFLGSAQPLPDSQPSGPAQASGTVTGAGSVSFTNLAGSLSYVAYALGLSVRFLVPGAAAAGEPSPAAVESNARTLLWDEDVSDYVPAEWRVDSSAPREFVGPTDPSTLGTVVGPVFGDRWTPTEAP